MIRGCVLSLAFAALAGALAFPGPVTAGMGQPFALPDSVAVMGTVYNGSQYSSMCIGCHSENPARFIIYGTYPFSEPASDYRGSHFVRNTLDGKTNLTQNKTYEKLDAWADSGGLSKYGNEATKTSVTGQTGEMLCESCHNGKVNVGYKLLLANYDEATGDMTLCNGCHALQASGPPNHHPMDGHTVGADADDPAPHELVTTHYSHLSNPIADPDDTWGVKYYGTPAIMVCASCHKPHNAMTSTGARILRRGNSLVSITLNKPINVVYTDDVPDAGVTTGDVILRAPSGKTATGIHRQYDMDSGKRIVVNSDPLCQACH